MTTPDITGLKRRGFSILRMTGPEWAALEETRQRGVRFTLVFPHDVARSGRSRGPVLVVIADGEQDGGPRIPAQLKLGWVKSIQSVATRDSRVAFDNIQAIAPGTLAELIDETLPSRLKASASSLLASTQGFEGISPKLGLWLLEKIAENAANNTAFQRLVAIVDRPRQFNNAVSLQQDALALALKAFGAPDAEAQSLALDGPTTALAGVRLQEDVVIEHDARWMPDWTLASSDLTGRAVFTRQGEELQIFTANKQPLEQLFGVDLIYLNEAHHSIIMVQYKMMDPLPRAVKETDWGFGTMKETEDQEWVVPINAQFKVEMVRMNQFNRPVSASGPYRMNSSPFFFKLVRRNGATAGPGIVMSLGHLETLLLDGALQGPNGGLRIAYGELKGHYLRGGTFVDLIQSGYIGSHSATTDHLQALIDATLAGGRAAVAAIQRALPDPRISEYNPITDDEPQHGLAQVPLLEDPA